MRSIFYGHGSSGEIFFENPELEYNAQSVKAPALGKLLYETQVAVLILNACRSAYSEPPELPKQVSDLHQQIRQFGSFAHAVMDCGARGVVAWRYSVFVDTAAQYMLDLYRALASGMPLGEAATFARKQLSVGDRDIEDWIVPIVFEAAPAPLFAKAQETIEIKLKAPAASAESGLPHAPDIGFIGRDETILKLDRTFDEQSIVLLHAYAGSGKTSTASEFVCWYQQTGGLSGPVLFTSFAQYKTLAEVLDRLGRVFEATLARNGIQWLTLTGREQRDIALQLLGQVPVFWIWDNVELISGFPVSTPSAWSEAEQKELADFLRTARDTKARFLLTSRRDERDWLHDLPARVQLPQMPFDERVQMTEALAKKIGRRLDDVDDWRPLLLFTQGHPLTITALVGQALRDRLRTRAQIADFARKLQAGETVFQDEASEGRTRSLAASLAYGFENAFAEAERRQLALLHLFQAYVDVDVLLWMGDPQKEWRLSEVAGLTREAGVALLDRAAEVGLLQALGGGDYSIHPALPWFFRRLFDQYYAKTRTLVTRSFAYATSSWGNNLHQLYISGAWSAIRLLALEEGNLLQALNLSLSNSWWPYVVGAMQGLRGLYEDGGRTFEWHRLVERVVPHFVDPSTDQPLEGKEKEWGIVMQYRVRLAREARLFEKANRLQCMVCASARQDAAAALAKSPQTWDEEEKNLVRNLAISFEDRAHIQHDQDLAACVDTYNQALLLEEQVGDPQSLASCLAGLAQAYLSVAEVRNLDLAESLYRRSFDLISKEDRLSRAACLSSLGAIALQRFQAARSATNTPNATRFLLVAEEYYEQALQLLPTNATRGLESVHYMLGRLYSSATSYSLDSSGNSIDLSEYFERAIFHLRESVRCSETLRDRFKAAKTRYTTALLLYAKALLNPAAHGFADAADWAEAALRDYQACQNAEQEVVKTLELLEQIKSAFKATPQPL
jgi:hypothetical protein